MIHMTFNRMTQLLKRDFIDFFKNKNVSLMCPIPILLTLFFVWIQSQEGVQGFQDSELLSLSFNMNLVIISTFALSLLLSEEKEMNTSLTLWLASISFFEWILSKIVLIFVLSLLTLSMTYFFIGYSPLNFLNYLFVACVSTLIMISIGIILGLIAPHQMAISFMGLPVVFVFFVLPVAQRLPAPWSLLVQVFPNYHYGQLIVAIGEGQSISLFHMSMLIVWLIAGVIGVFMTYRKYKLGFFNLK